MSKSNGNGQSGTVDYQSIYPSKKPPVEISISLKHDTNQRLNEYAGDFLKEHGVEPDISEVVERFIKLGLNDPNFIKWRERKIKESSKTAAQSKTNFEDNSDIENDLNKGISQMTSNGSGKQAASTVKTGS